MIVNYKNRFLTPFPRPNMVNSENSQRPDVYLLYNETRVMFGPTRQFYTELLKLALDGGWKPARPIERYQAHLEVIDGHEARAIGAGLERAVAAMFGGATPIGDEYPISNNCDRWSDILAFFRGGEFQVDDLRETTRVFPWSAWDSTSN